MTATIYQFPLKNKPMPVDQTTRIADKMLDRMMGDAEGPLSVRQAAHDLEQLKTLWDSCFSVRAEVGAVCQAMAQAIPRNDRGTLPMLTAHRIIKWATYLLNEDHRTSHDDRDTVRHALLSFKARIGYQERG